MLNEYLVDLAVELEKRGVSDVKDTVQYFEEMMTDRMENGETVEDIIASMGTPKDVVASLYGYQEEAETKEIPEDSLHVMSFPDVRDIKIENVTYDIDFIPSDGGEVVLEYNDDKYCTLNVSFQHGKLKIGQEYAFKGITALFASLAKIFSDKDNNNAGRYKATISLPVDLKPDLDMETVSGDVALNGINIGDFDLDTVSGDVKLSGCSLNDCSLESVSGDFDIRDLTVAKKFDCDLVSGDIRLDRIACEKIDIDSVSGDVDILVDGARVDYDIKVSKVLKDISIKGNRRSCLKVDTVSGDVRFDFTR